MQTRPAARGRERPPRKSERTRRAILDAALEFLWTHPFRDMSVNRLMLETSLSRPTFYQHFKDLHELMEALLSELESEVLRSAALWQTGEGARVATLQAALKKLVDVCYRRGPILRAIFDAAPQDPRLDAAWSNFINDLDQLVATQIEAEQARGLIAPLDPMPVATALNCMDVLLFIKSFGQRPRAAKAPVLKAIEHIWTSTLYPSTPVAGNF